MLSIIIPAYNEEDSISSVINDIRDSLSIPHEIIVIDDGSTDRTGEIAASTGVKVIKHPCNAGYGRSLKDGMEVAKYDLIAITDADRSYPVREISNLFRFIEEGYDMVVGARKGRIYEGSLFKMIVRKIFHLLSEYAVGRKIEDINSGLRVFKKDLVIKFWNTLGEGFSFTTTITLAMMLNGYYVKYVSIDYYDRKGKSKIRYFRDALRSAQIVVESILYYNPIKIFILLSGFIFLLGIVGILGCIFGSHNLWPLLASLGLTLSPVTLAIGFNADLVRKINAKNLSKRD